MQPTSRKRVEDETWLGWEGDPLGIVQETEIWSYEQMVYVQSRISPGEWGSNFSGNLIYEQIT